jgi:hypothetical protein
LERNIIDLDKMIYAFNRYLSHENKRISRAQFESNMKEKFADPIFQNDMTPLILDSSKWNINNAMDSVIKNIFPLLSGEPWKKTRKLISV